MTRYEDFLKTMRGKRCAVLGAGISNRPLIRLLLEAGVEAAVFDHAENPELRQYLTTLREEKGEFETHLGADCLRLLHGFDYIFKTPVLRPDIPELLEERRRGAILTSEMELFLRFCPAPVIAVTGSDGKTTTSSLIARMLETAASRVFLGGNIGTPLLERLPEMKEDDRVVLELSSFQLMSMRQSPQRAVLTNISPNHLDVHKDYEEYIDAKKNLFLHQRLDDLLIVNGASEPLKNFPLEARGRYIWTESRPWGGAPLYGLEGDQLFYQQTPESDKIPLLRRSDLRLPGRYNALNVLSAAAAVEGLVPMDKIRETACSFGGVEHRVELIRELAGVRYYDSSIDSSPARSCNTLSAFAEEGTPVLLICGGKDKNCDYTGLGAAIASCCREVYLSGTNAALIREALRREAPAALPVFEVDDYREALRRARQSARPGEAVLLSPAGTSFDRYRNFMERGRDFAAAVQDL